ncbi:MAG: hypothetical protein KME17_05370 [Cyanosarcina radialis HA8281-LM2]|jgi:hypothetical protein|nr:hypothetical protein [Cyanosarcina radialis HA8281-LM2]
MLKLTYTDTFFHLEFLTQSVEDWVAGRVILAMRVGNSICVEPSTASFLLAADLPELSDLEVAIEREGIDAFDLSRCDAESVEVSISGSWLSGDPDAEEGVFVAALGDRIESLLFQLWFQSQRGSPSAAARE